MELLLYLIKVNLAILLLYGLYRLLFRGDTFFRWKRAILLAMLLTALLYPLASLPGRAMLPETFAGGGLLPVYYLSEIVVFPGAAPQPAPLWGGEATLRAATAVYLAGAIFFLARIILQAVSLLALAHRATPAELYGTKIYARKGIPAPFSFFTRIFLDPEKYSENELKEFILHESVHARQKHSFDLIFAEVAGALCWFNPLVRLLKKEIRINLEYIADRAVLKSGCEAERYQLHLLRLSNAKAIATITNNLNVSPLKKRIIMMNRKKTSPASIWKYTLLAPAFALLAFFNESLKAEIRRPAPAADATIEAPPAGENVQGRKPAAKKTVKHDTPQKPSAEDGVLFPKFRLPTEAEWEYAAMVSAGAVTHAAKAAPKTKTDSAGKTVYLIADELPKFPGGDKALMKHLAENVSYPEAAVRDSIQGRVVVRFTVSDNGKIEDIEIVRSLQPDCDAAALKAIKTMPDWIPGKEKGKPVHVSFTLPIIFRLQ